MAVGAMAREAPPWVTKVDPPNWWIGLPDPMVLLTGGNLNAATVSTSTPGVRVTRTAPGRNSHYLFVWLRIDRTARPGNVRLSVTASHGDTSADLRLQRRNPASAGNSRAGFQGFSPDDVIYLIMPDRFADGDARNNFPASGTYDRTNPHAYHGGDLRGIVQRLPYLKDLGVTTLWITPVYNNNDHTGQDYHGYGAVDMYAVEEHLGTLDDYRSLVRTAHGLGMKVLLDVVPNHLGPTHPWVDDPPSEHWLHGTRAKHLIASDQFQHLTDPHASPNDWRRVTEGWFVDALPDMGTDDPLAAQYLRQNALWWAETGALDGFRLDTFPYVDRAFWRDFHALMHSAYPRFRTVGEVSGYDPVVASFFAGGRTNDGINTGVDTVFDFTLYSALRKVVLKDAPATLLEDVLQRDWLFPRPETLVTFLGNHDTPRFMGEPGASVAKLKLAFALLLTLRGIPQIYAGDEIGMPGGDDPDNRRDFPGGFPGDPRNAFTAAGRAPEEQQIFEWVRGLLHLRAEHPALRRGRQVHIFSDAQTMAYLREVESGPGRPGERLLMVMNNAGQTRTVAIPVADTPLKGARRLGRVLAESDAAVSGDGTHATLPPRSLSIYRIEE